MSNNIAAGKEYKVFIQDEKGEVDDSKYVTVHEPPMDWKPAKATAEELSYFGYPKRPEKPEKLAEWEKIVSGKWVNPAFGVSKRKHKLKSDIEMNASFQNNANWSGYITNPDGTAYMSIEASWQIPAVSAPSAYQPADASVWIGLGGTGNNAFAQMGTTSQVVSPGTSRYYAWYELINTSFTPNTELPLTSIVCSPQDHIFSKITLVPAGDNSYYDVRFYLTNTTTSTSTSFTIRLTQFGGIATTAEFIAERQTIVKDDVEAMANYPLTTTGDNNSYVSFWGCNYMTGTSSSYIPLTDSDNVIILSMYNNSTNNLLAVPGSVDSNNGFNICWKNYN